MPTAVHLNVCVELSVIKVWGHPVSRRHFVGLSLPQTCVTHGLTQAHALHMDLRAWWLPPTFSLRVLIINLLHAQCGLLAFVTDLHPATRALLAACYQAAAARQPRCR